MHEECNVSALIGKTIVSIEGIANSNVTIKTTDGAEYKMYHDQDCCENVSIEDISGDLDDLVGAPIIIAEAVVSCEETPEQAAKEEKRKQEEGEDYYDYRDSWTWTFYKFATIKGYVTIRWYGESNGDYSESVDFHPLFPDGTINRYEE